MHRCLVCTPSAYHIYMLASRTAASFRAQRHFIRLISHGSTPHQHSYAAMSRTSIELVQYPQSILGPSSLKSASQNEIMHPVVRHEPDTQAITHTPAGAADQMPNPKKATTAIVLVTVVCVTMISSLLAGLVTVGLPTMAHDLGLGADVLLWYVRIY